MKDRSEANDPLDPRDTGGWPGPGGIPQRREKTPRIRENASDETGDETGDASSPRPDENVVSEIGDEAGITYEDHEPLRMIEKVGERDQRRWELDPASADDWQERQRELKEDEKDDQQD
jgi:hypothetical protein